MTTTRSKRRPTFPSTLVKPQLPIINTNVPTTDISLDSPPDSCIPVPTPVYRTPITHRRTLPLRRPTERQSEQDDIEEIVCFLKKISWCAMPVYKAISEVAISVFHGTIATFQWLAVVAFVAQVIMSTTFSVSLRLYSGWLF